MRLPEMIFADVPTCRIRFGVELSKNSLTLAMKLADPYKAIVERGGRFHLSASSSKARGLTDADIQGKPAAARRGSGSLLTGSDARC